MMMSGQKEHDDFSDRKFRKTLNVTIINNFLDLENISSSPNYSTLSAFFHHMGNSFKEIPHIFVNNPTVANSDDALDRNGENGHKREEDHLSGAFTEWLMMWLLRVLSQPCAAIVHKECKDLFVSLLQLVKTNNPRNFRQYILQMINLLSELNNMVDKFMEEETNSTCSIQNYFYSEKMPDLKNSQELDLVNIIIVFSNPDDCEELAEKITSVLDMMMNNITQFLPDQCHILFKQLCSQIELGDLTLKNESVIAVTSLIHDQGLTFPINDVNYLFSCLQAIITFCCTYEEPVPEHLKSTETAIAPLLTIVIKNMYRSENKYVLNSSTLGKVLQTLIEDMLKALD